MHAPPSPLSPKEPSPKKGASELVASPPPSSPPSPKLPLGPQATAIATNEIQAKERIRG